MDIESSLSTYTNLIMYVDVMISTVTLTVKGLCIMYRYHDVARPMLHNVTIVQPHISLILLM